MSLSERKTPALTAKDVLQSASVSFSSAQQFDEPYTRWQARSVLPEPVTEAICTLPLAAPELGGVSGKREKHNATRTYFDAANQGRFAVAAAMAGAFQTTELARLIETRFATNLTGTYLRIEYAQDVDGFWLEPHSDLGVKVFTLLIYLSDDPAHAGLGTDIYTPEKEHFGTSPFEPNSALVFVPSDVTFHGFERRPISGVRKSLIINYVTNEWRDRDQLAFPDEPIRV